MVEFQKPAARADGVPVSPPETFRTRMSGSSGRTRAYNPSVNSQCCDRWLIGSLSMPKERHDPLALIIGQRPESCEYRHDPAQIDERTFDSGTLASYSCQLLSARVPVQLLTRHDLHGECRTQITKTSLTTMIADQIRMESRYFRLKSIGALSLHDLGQCRTFGALHKRDDLGLLVDTLGFGLGCLRRLRSLRGLGLLAGLPLWPWLFGFGRRPAVLDCIGNQFVLLNRVAVVRIHHSGRKTVKLNLTRLARYYQRERLRIKSIDRWQFLFLCARQNGLHASLVLSGGKIVQVVWL